jgi:L-malate glycosyltransferase
MRIAMLCYASVGGSGVVATELARALAGRGHEVYVLSRGRPFRWPADVGGLSFVEVETPSYPLFREPQYVLALANAIMRLSLERRLDIVHAHYAIPHATAAYLAHQMLAASSEGCPPRTVTTLHGTDITLLGSEPSYKGAVAFSIDQAHAVTAVSASLRRDTQATLGITRDITVIPNFLDDDTWRRRHDPVFRDTIREQGRYEAIVVHASNFRPVKRVEAVFEVFQRIRQRVHARLIMIGDGPDRRSLEQRVAAAGATDAVQFIGEQQDLVRWLSVADLFLLPSSQESFGLAALEAMACEVPVVASRVGGLPEVIEDGVSGFLCPVDAIDVMAERSIDLLTNDRLRARIGGAAAALARERFRADVVVPRYEACYEEVLAINPCRPRTASPTTA